MLNVAERFKILKLIQRCCKIGGFPAVVDLSGWRLLEHSATGTKIWPSMAYFGSFVLHTMYKVATFVSTCANWKSAPLHQLVVHAIIAFGAPIMIFWHYQLFINHPGAFQIFVRMTLTRNIGGTIIEDREHTSFVNRLKAYTIQDVVAINLPPMIAVVVVAIIGTYISYPTLQLLLYSGLPEQFQTWLTFAVLLVEELRFLLILCAIAVPVWILHVISFDLINHQLEALIGSIGRAGNKQKMQLLYKSLRHIQLYTTITNVVNRYIIFVWKVYCIAICIGTGYAAIVHFSDHPVFGVMYYLMLIDATLIYTVSYGKAFKIPGLFQEATQQAMLRFRQADRSDIFAFKKQMGSIPRVGIKVGEFHVLERESTPTFVHYVLSNIASMLVAHER